MATQEILTATIIVNGIKFILSIILFPLKLLMWLLIGIILIVFIKKFLTIRRKKKALKNAENQKNLCIQHQAGSEVNNSNNIEKLKQSDSF